MQETIALQNSSFITSKPTFSLVVPTLLLDACVIFLAAIVAAACRWGTFWFPEPPHLKLVVATSIAAIPIFALFSPSVFSRGVRFWWLLRQVIYGVAVLGTLVLIALFVIKDSALFSRSWIGFWMLSSVVGLTLSRLFLISALGLLRKRGINQKKVVIVGAGPMGRSLVSRVQSAAWPGFQIVALFDRRKNRSVPPAGLRIHDNFDELLSFSEQNNIREVWVALPLKAEKEIETIAEQLMQTPVTVRFVPDTFGLRLFQHRVTEIHGVPMFDLSSSKMVGLNRVIKASLDYTMALVILATVGPLVMLPIAIAIKLTSRGPVLFHQKRHGWDGKRITVYKFRSMKLHTEDSGAVTQAGANDSRFTSVGKFLRRTSLDELPQFINVLQGRMSIVGPRPHAVEHNEEYKTKIRHYMRRHKVKPGITGFAQIKGWRGETDTVHKMRKRVQYDLYYLENWTVGFDLKIIWLTFFLGFIHPNAH